MSSSRRLPVVWVIDPLPVFRPIAQPFAHWIDQYVTLFLRFLMMIAQAVVEEIALPRDTLCACQKFLPVRDDGFQTGFERKSDEGVQMIRHEQQQPAIPDQALMIPGCCGKYGVTDVRAAKMVLVARLAIDGDEEKAAFRNPLRDLVWQAFADGEIHRRKIMGF